MVKLRLHIGTNTTDYIINTLTSIATIFDWSKNKF